MKFNIEVDVDWLSEDGGVDDQIKAEIIANISNSISKQTVDETRKTAAANATKAIDRKINALLNSWLDKPVIITDSYGDVKQKYENIMELIKTRFDGFLDDKVDEKGEVHTACSYGGKMTRAEWMVDKRIEIVAKKWAADVAKSVDARIKEIMRDNLKEQLGATLVGNLGIDRIVDATTKK